MTAFTSVDLTTDLCGVRLPTPLILASGILGTSAALMARVGRCGAGAVTSKSCSPQPRAGHPNPTVIKWGPGFLNAVGLANPGMDAQVAILRETKARLADSGVAVIGSIFAETVDGFARVAETISAAQPDLIEVNISCPNVAHELGAPFSAEPESAAAVTRAVKAATGIPIIVKLSPNVADIAAIARAVEAAGADALAAINTVVRHGDRHRSRAADPRQPRGRDLGPAIKPIAVRCIYQCYRAVSIPIVGIGGVSSGADAIELMMAGARAVGVGSAVHWGGVETFSQIAEEMIAFLASHGYARAADVVGLAHREEAR
jgi:dihydroorotate dehydrogenase (NAD+) catalytic subunit